MWACIPACGGKYRLQYSFYYYEYYYSAVESKKNFKST